MQKLFSDDPIFLIIIKLILIVTLSFSLFPVGKAVADNLASPPVYRENITGPGSVNVITGALTFSSVDIQSGVAGTSDFLSLSRSYNSQGGPSTPLAALGFDFTHSFMMHLGWGGSCTPFNIIPDPLKCSITASAFGKSYEFLSYNIADANIGGSALSSKLKDGAFLEVISQSPVTFRLWDKGGAYAVFEVSNNYYSGEQFNSDVFVKYVQFPDGSFWAFNYQPAGSITPDLSFPARTLNRLESVINSRGDGLAFTYLNSGIGGSPDKEKRMISKISSFHINCSPTCSRNNISSVNYTYSSLGWGFDSFEQTFYLLSKVTYPDGSERSYGYDSAWGSLVNAVKNSANSYDDAEYTYGGIFGTDFMESSPVLLSTVVMSFKDANNNIWNYQYDNSAMYNIYTTLTQPDARSYVYHSPFDWSTGAGNGNQPLPDWMKDPLNRVTHYVYDNLGRFLSITRPEGDSDQQALDDNENATEVRSKPKSGSGLSDIVRTFHFPTCSASNRLFCNKPDYAIDGNNNRTDYQYDSTSGGLAVQLSPADVNGKRAVKRLSYGLFSPAAGITAPPNVTLPQASLVTAEDECGISGVTGNTVDFSYVCPAQNRLRKSYLYESSTAGSPSPHKLVSSSRESAGSTLTSSFSYDTAGNVSSVTDPVGNVSYTVYDSRRRKLYEIGADPDGSGPLPRPVIHHIYNSDGNESKTEVGTGNAVDGSDMAVIRYKRMTYSPGTNKVVKIEEVLP